MKNKENVIEKRKEERKDKCGKKKDIVGGFGVGAPKPSKPMAV